MSEKFVTVYILVQYRDENGNESDLLENSEDYTNYTDLVADAEGTGTRLAASLLQLAGEWRDTPWPDPGQHSAEGV